MSVQALLQHSQRLQLLQSALQSGKNLLIEELWNAPKALIAALAQQTTGKHILILKGGSVEETRLFHDFSFFTEMPVVDFPAWETLPSENISPSPDIVGERYHVLKQVASGTTPYIITTNLQACLQRLLPPETFNHLYLELNVGETFPFEPLIQQFVKMGYRRSAIASDKGEFSVRGGIIDIFPVSSPDPFRLEFWGDEIESMRHYDPVGQKSVRKVESMQITPAQELELIQGKDHLCTLLDYLGDNVIVIFDDLLALEDRYAALIASCGTPKGTFGSIESWMDRVESLQKIYWSQQNVEELSEVHFHGKRSEAFSSLSFEMFNRKLQAERWQHGFLTISTFLLPNLEEVDSQELLNALNQWKESQLQVYFLCGSEAEEENLQRRLIDARVQLPKKTQYVLGYLSSGLVIPDINFLLFPTTEITGRYKIRRQKQRSSYHAGPSSSFDLAPGEMVVHFNHGIGKYLGIDKKNDVNGIPKEFLVIEYAENGKLFVPLNQAYLVTKYIGADDETPKLHTIGSGRWKRTREKTEHAIQGYATELLEIYAKRQMMQGDSYKPDGEDMLAFEEDFPFVETEDQLAAIAAIKNDMVTGKCMDRLVCGDVGYGKTEVAMRAAFKAVADGNKQVAVLVPTTVLAMQHYENFVERMANFPINIAALSRFRSPKEVRETLQGVSEGSIDIVIGTHRIISEDVRFKHLGLIIIDEEQRFGVKAKEFLKKIKAGVDCLTLSATPIPRTLYLSLVGARDMSVISTPPQDRLPITTIITEATDEALKTALARELARDGQAYVIHNRVETIYGVASKIQKFFPQTKVVICHGQMGADEIDAVFHAFKSGQAQILVATTIVENGIDIPNANTILIDRADHFGLADLYQLRGRVGRWNRRAYAYFLVRNLRSLSEISRKRLQALAESSGYGGGMKVAMRDLELRGAGNILGTEQSGQVAAIGFHLYCKMLKRTLLKLQGKNAAAPHVDSKLEFPFDARLSEDYVNDTNLRIEFYQRFGEADSLEEIDAIWDEIRDRFGTPPDPALWLYHISRIRFYASIHGYLLLKLEGKGLSIEQQKGKGVIQKRLKIPPFKTPDQFEKVLLAIL